MVREYFELHGFLVRQLSKFQRTSSRKKTTALAEEEIDLLVYNPQWMREREADFQIFASELPYVQRAVVAVKAWHTKPRFTAKMLKNNAEMFKFLEKNVLKQAEDLFRNAADEIEKEADLRKILVVPGLPATGNHRNQVIDLLKENGVDGVITFPSMLRDMVRKVEINRNYIKSDALQFLRLLKAYDMVNDQKTFNF